MSIKCNICWHNLDSEAYLALSCSHIFCVKDAEEYFSREPICPVCDTRLRSRNGLVKLNLQVHAEKTIALCGLPPKKILEIATKAIEFFNYQKNTELQYYEQESKTLKEEHQRAESEKTQQLVEYQNKVKKLTRQLERERREHEKEMEELNKLKSKQSRRPGSNYVSQENFGLLIPNTGEITRPKTDNPSKNAFKNRLQTPQQLLPETSLSIPKSKTIVKKSPAMVSTVDRFAMIRKQVPFHGTQQTETGSIKQENLFTPRFFQSSNRTMKLNHPNSSSFLLRNGFTPKQGE